MKPKCVRKTWRQRCHKGARWCGIALLSGALLGLAALLYLNKVGLPDLVKNPLLAKLRAHGLDLQFSRLRWHWYRGIVAENISLGGTATPLGPQLFIDEAEVHLNHAALRRLHLEIDAFVVRRGRFSWPMPQEADLPAQQFNVDDISSELRLLPKDRWELANFQAQCLGAQLRLTGSLDNASSIRDWGLARATNRPPTQWPTALHQLMTRLEAVRFRAPPQIQLSVQGDARLPSSLKADGTIEISRATGSNGSLNNALLSVHCAGLSGDRGLVRTEINVRAERVRLETNQCEQVYVSARFTNSMADFRPKQVDWQVQLRLARTAWGTARSLRLAAHTSETVTNEAIETEIHLNADEAKGAWGQIKRAEIEGLVVHKLSWPSALAATAGLTNSPKRLKDPVGGPAAAGWLPERLRSNVRLNQAETSWGVAEELRLKLDAAHSPPSGSATNDPGWGLWAKLVPFQVDWECEVRTLQSPQMQVSTLAFQGKWRAPALTLERFRAFLYGGEIDAQAQLNAASRELKTQATIDFDAQQLGLLLNPSGQRWLRQFAWQKPPFVRGEAGVILPAWTNAQPNWRQDVIPTLWLAGYAESGPSSFRGAQASSARLHFGFSNSIWHIPDLAAVRPEGRLEFSYTENSRTRDFAWQVHSHIDPKALLPLLAPAQQRTLNFFEFTSPPDITGMVWGRWQDAGRLGFDGQLAISNVTFRGESCSRFSAGVRFTNSFLEAREIDVLRGTETIAAPKITLDLNSKRLAIEHAKTHIDPLAVTRAIGDKTTKTLLPYHFEQPPFVEVNGSLVLPGPKSNDLQFVISGGPFQYWKLRVPTVAATVLWKDETLTITNLQGLFYQGVITGSLAADFSPTNGTDISFQTAVTNADLHLLLTDVSRATNKLEGLLSGNLAITHLSTWDWKSWQGYGQVGLRQGLIWDIPLFGMISPMLNAVVPGMGNSRASEGNATFTIKDSVVYTKNLEIRAPALRLYYDGSIDFQGQVNARVEASLLRDLPWFGRLFSLALSPVSKIFEYKITGTLTNPQSKSVYLVPNLILAPLHPVRTLKGLFGHDEQKSQRPPTPLPPRKEE